MFTRIKYQKYGRNFKPGVPLCRDLRNEALELATDPPIREVGRRLHIQPLTRYAKLYWDKGINIGSAPRTHMRTASKLSLADLKLLETLVESKRSTSLNEIKSQLSSFSGCGEVYQDMFAIIFQVQESIHANGWESLHYSLLNFKCLMSNHATFDTQLGHVSASCVHA